MVCKAFCSASVSQIMWATLHTATPEIWIDHCVNLMPIRMTAQFCGRSHCMQGRAAWQKAMNVTEGGRGNLRGDNLGGR